MVQCAKLFFFTALYLGTLSSALAQSAYQAGLLPAINLNKKFENDWSINAKIESRQLLSSGVFNAPADTEYKYVLTDFSIILAKKLGLNSRIAGGYLIRVEEGELIQRFIQQYTAVNRMPAYRLAHRFLADQTFSKTEKPDYRLRYRITSEIPLDGESADPKEFYLKISNEYVNSLQDNIYDLEIRLIPLLGYGVNENNKIEIGLDYRVNSLFDNNSRHTFWTSINWFIEI
jgi:hypothetical protein